MVVDLTALLRGVHGEAFRVVGVVVGDRAAAVDPAALTGAHDTAFLSGQIYSNHTVYRAGTDGAHIEIPLAERIATVIAHGGWLRAGDVELRVANGSIEQIRVRGSSLASLDISREDAIERRFGPAAGHERTFDCRHHHYPDRALIVTWHSIEDRLDALTICRHAFHEPRLGARELLDELLDESVASMQPGAAPPHRSAGIRYARADALARALGLGSVDNVMRGGFLDGELAPGRARVLDELAERSPFRDEPEDPDLVGMPRPSRAVFNHLLRYRRDVERVVRATAGWLVCSDPSLLGMIETQNRVAGELKVLMVDVDRWLCTLLAPDHQTFTRRDLIAHHAWPDVDLDAIEAEDF